MPPASTRQRICRTARQMVNRGSDLPVDEVARRAGVSVQTLYAHFGSKRGLILAVIDDMQRDIDFYGALERVFAAAHGEAALRAMVGATIDLWDRGWQLVAYTLRARRSDPEIAAQLAEVDTMRRLHLLIICRRIDFEGRLLAPLAPEAAADIAFTLSSPTVYEDLVKARGWPTGRVAGLLADVVVSAIVDPGIAPVLDPPPNWGAAIANLGRPT